MVRKSSGRLIIVNVIIADVMEMDIKSGIYLDAAINVFGSVYNKYIAFKCTINL